MPLLQNLPINRKITVVLLGVCGAALGVFAAALFVLQAGQIRTTVTREVTTIANLAADHLATAVVQRDTKAIDELMASLRTDEIIRSARVVDATGVNLGTYGLVEEADPGREADGLRFEGDELLLKQAVVWGGKRVGSLYVHANQRELVASLVRTLATALAGGLALSLGVTALILRPSRRILIEPIQMLANTATEITRKLDFGLRAPNLGNDELGRLAAAFNLMLEQVQAREAALQDSNERHRRLFDHSPLPLWLVATADRRILAVNEAAVRHYGYTREEFRELTLGQLEEAAEAAELTDPTSCTEKTAHSQRCHQRKDGSRITVELRSRPHEFAGKPACLVQAVDVSERQQAEAALRASEERFRAVIENLSEGLALYDGHGRILFANSRMAELAGMDPAALRQCNALELLGLPTQTGTATERQTKETELQRADGSRIIVSISTTSLVKATGEMIGTVAVVCDKTAQKQAEAEIAESQSRLITVSRLAGMAEVATGVLHNVGNVLNSVNVSATLVADRLRESRLSGLQRTVKLLEQHSGDLGRFFTEDPKGRLIPEYLGKLAWQLENERTELVGELAGLTKNLDHIKEVVAMQQNYARVDGVKESFSPAVLVEDALRINEDALVRYRVEVERNYAAELPRVSVEKNKVLEILINLITNARHAVQEVDRPDRRIRLQVARASDHRVSVEITDNGMGIAAENLVRIFQHGFTTKKNGHGFGLHSGALAARQMGGSLTVNSEGPGLGATFRLELPIAESTNADN